MARSLRSSQAVGVQMPASSALEWVLGALLLGLWAALNWRILLEGHTFILADACSVFYPLWKWGAEALNSGHIPLWCPDSALGMPYLADPTLAAWYPVKDLVYRFLDPTTAFTVLVAGHSLWALAGFWVLSRLKGFGPWEALWGCLVVGFSFNSLMLPWATSMPLAMAWTPWVFAAFEVFWKGKRGGWSLLAAAMALQWSAGYPLFGFLTVLLVCLDGFLRVVLEKESLSARRVLPFTGAMGLAALFNAAWILPLAEYLPFSNFSRRVAMPAANPWSDLSTFFDPFHLGHPLHSPNPVNLFLFRDYFVGLPVLVLVLWAFVKRRLPGRPLIMAATVLVLSLGETAWVGGWLKAILPGYGWVVRSGYWLPLLVFTFALVSMEAFEGSRNREKGTDPTGAILALGVYAAALVLGVPWSLATFWFSLALLLLFFLLGTGGNLRPALLCAALILSLGPVDRGFYFTADRSFYEVPPPLAGQLKLPGRLYQAPDWVDAHRMISGFGVADAYSKLKTNLIPDWPLCFGLDEAGYSNTLFPMSFFRWYYLPPQVGKDGAQQVLDYLGVRYGLGLPQLSPEESLWVNPRPFPLWFTVRRARVEGTWELDSDEIVEGKFDLGGDCFIADPAQAGDYGPRLVTEASRNANGITLEAKGEGKALLVSSELAYPGWIAEVGGKQRSLQRVNHDFRGLVLEDGEEKADILYRPMTFRLGCFFSLLSLAFGFGWGLKSLFEKSGKSDMKPPIKSDKSR